MVGTPEYAGDLSGAQAWALLKDNPKAQLVDVRTTAEWAFVGLPDTESLGREVHRVEWQSYPQGAQNPNFVTQASEAVRRAGADQHTPLIFLCRSGGRSRAAAIAMTHAGFSKAYNLAGGFEGNLDSAHHRGQQSGWKAEGLPWRQS